MKLHKVVDRKNRWGGFSKTTLCGRSNSNSTDGMNVTSKESEVTCKFCLKMIENEKSKLSQ